MGSFGQHTQNDEMIRVAIIDGCEKTVKSLLRIVNNYFGDKEHSVSVFSSPMEFISETVYSSPPPPNLGKETEGSNGEVLLRKKYAFYDIVFLEADFPHLDGFAAAKKLKDTDDGYFLIMMNATDKYAVDAYSVEAKDYLLKPINPQRTEESLCRAENYLKANAHTKRITINVDGVLHRVSLNKIKYIEVNGHFLKYHLTNEILISRGKLDEKEDELKNCGFFRIYKCYLVNLSYVDKVTVNSVYIGEEELLISRFRKKNFIPALKDHVPDII